MRERGDTNRVYTVYIYIGSQQEVIITKTTGTLRPESRPIASFQGATFYCHNIISEHHRALKQIAKNF